MTWSGGTPINRATADQQIRFSIYELSNTEKYTWAKAQKVGSDAASLAAGYAYYVERPKLNLRAAADRYAVAKALDSPTITTAILRAVMP